VQHIFQLVTPPVVVRARASCMIDDDRRNRGSPTACRLRQGACKLARVSEERERQALLATDQRLFSLNYTPI